MKQLIILLMQQAEQKSRMSDDEALQLASLIGKENEGISKNDVKLEKLSVPEKADDDDNLKMDNQERTTAGR